MRRQLCLLATALALLLVVQVWPWTPSAAEAQVRRRDRYRSLTEQIVRPVSGWVVVDETTPMRPKPMTLTELAEAQQEAQKQAQARKDEAEARKKAGDKAKADRADKADKSDKQEPKPEDQPYEAPSTPRGFAMLYTMEKTYDQDDYTQAVKFLVHNGLRSLDRYLVYRGKEKDALRSVHVTAQATEEVKMPVLTLYDPLGNRIETMGLGTDRRQMDQAISLAAQLSNWYQGVPHRLMKAERIAQLGRFALAMKQVDAIADEDVRVTTVLNQLHMTQEEKAALASQKDKQAVVGRYYPDAQKLFRQRFAVLANERLARARALFDDGRLQQARLEVVTMVQDGSDYPAVATAADLVEQIKKRLAANVQAKSAESAKPTERARPTEPAKPTKPATESAKPAAAPGGSK